MAFAFSNILNNFNKVSWPYGVMKMTNAAGIFQPAPKKIILNKSYIK